MIDTAGRKEAQWLRWLDNYSLSTNRIPQSRKHYLGHDLMNGGKTSRLRCKASVLISDSETLGNHSSARPEYQLCSLKWYLRPLESCLVPESLPRIRSCSDCDCDSERFQSSRWCLVPRPRTVRVQDESGNSTRRSLVDKMLGH